MLELKEYKKRVKFLEAEREKIWKRLVKLEELVEYSANFNEKEARQASKKTAEFRNKSEERWDEIKLLGEKSNSEFTRINSLLTKSNDLYGQISEKNSAMLVIFNDIKTKHEALETKIDEIETILENHPELEEEIESLDNNLTQVEDNSNRIEALLKNALSQKSDLDKLYLSINGEDVIDDESGESSRITGLKDELKSQFEGLDQQLKDLKVTFSEFESGKTEEVDENLRNWSSKYDSIVKRINELLPNAHAAGLSYAYSEKKNIEIVNLKNLKAQFNFGIGGLILISVLAFGVSIYFLKSSMSFLEIVNVFPNLASAILPLYIPILWFTYNANKKMNLSKRLIEEYTHKEVVSKTFEGLAREIEEISEGDISNELKIKLLFNILEISTENPGKLISDYKNSDHPIVEMIDQQTRIEKALKKIEDVPGVNRLRKLLTKEKGMLVDENLDKIVAALKESMKN